MKRNQPKQSKTAQSWLSAANTFRVSGEATTLNSANGLNLVDEKDRKVFRARRGAGHPQTFKGMDICHEACG